MEKKWRGIILLHHKLSTYEVAVLFFASSHFNIHAAIMDNTDLSVRLEVKFFPWFRREHGVLLMFRGEIWLSGYEKCEQTCVSFFCEAAPIEKPELPDCGAPETDHSGIVLESDFKEFLT